MTATTLLPAYGRDYATAADAVADWIKNKDFVIADHFDPYDGKPINREQAGKRTFGIRYAGKTKIVHVTADTKQFRKLLEADIFRPDCTLAIKLPGNSKEPVRAQTISRTGGLLFVTEHATNGGQPAYGLSHRSGWGLPTPRGAKIGQIATRGRRFYRALTAEQRKLWKTSKNGRELMKPFSKADRDSLLAILLK